MPLEPKPTEDEIELYPDLLPERTFDDATKQENVLNFPMILGSTIRGGKMNYGSGNKCLKFEEDKGLWMGNADFDSAPFRVNMSGVIYGTGAVIDGTSTIGGRTASVIASAIDASGHFIDDRLDTSAKQILGEFTFGSSGAIQIGTYVNGTSGDIRISPNGIVGRDKNGANTFTIDGTTGDATFAGTLSAATGTLGSLEIASGGNIRLGQTAYNTGTGFWMGDDAGVTKFSMGNGTSKYFTYDGTDIKLVGGIMTNSKILTTLTAGEDITAGNAVCLGKQVVTTYRVYDTNPSDDSFVNREYPDTNYGSSNYLEIGMTSNGYEKNAFIKFLSYQLPSFYPWKAILHLYPVDIGGNGAYANVKFVAADWDESTITWNNQPGVINDPNTGSPFSYSANLTAYGSVDVDITPAIQYIWKEHNYGSSLEWYGIELEVASTNNGDYTSLASKEYTGLDDYYYPGITFYSSEKDNKIYKADKSDYFLSNVLGVAIEDVPSGSSGRVQVGGIVDTPITSDLVGENLYLQLSGNIGLHNKATYIDSDNWSVMVGRALSETELLLNIKKIQPFFIQSRTWDVPAGKTYTYYIPPWASRIYVHVDQAVPLRDFWIYRYGANTITIQDSSGSDLLTFDWTNILTCVFSIQNLTTSTEYSGTINIYE